MAGHLQVVIEMHEADLGDGKIGAQVQHLAFWIMPSGERVPCEDVAAILKAVHFVHEGLFKGLPLNQPLIIPSRLNGS